MIRTTERIRQTLVSLHMARALETLDQTLSRLEKGEISAIGSNPMANALARLEFIKRAEVLHLLGPPGTGKSHLATAIGVAAVKAGRVSTAVPSRN